MRTASLAICCSVAIMVVASPSLAAAGEGAARASLQAGAGPLWPGGDMARYAGRSLAWSARLELRGPAGFGAAAQIEQAVLARKPVMPEQIDLQLGGVFAGLSWSRPLGAGFGLTAGALFGRWTLRMSAPRAPRHHRGPAHRISAGLSWSASDRLRIGTRWSRTAGLLTLSGRRHLRASARALRFYMSLDI